jgi:hypothetical protein
MRQTISGLVAALAVVAASAVPAMACGGVFQGGCSPCGQAYVSPCAQVYVQPQVYMAPGCNSCGGVRERLPDPVEQYEAAPASVQQYYYADQGPTYSGPGNYAPYRVYREGGYHHHSYYGYGHHHYRSWHAHTGYRYGYAPHHVYGPRAYGPRYGYHARMGMSHHYGYREHTLRRYY